MAKGRKVKLKDVAEVFSGIFLKTDPDGDVAYLQAKDCDEAVVTRYASRVHLSPKAQKSLLRPGDILFASKGANYISRVFYGEAKAVASTSFFVIRTRQETLSPEYLCWFLRLPATERYFKTFQIGSTTPLIRKNVVDELEIPVPDRHTQTLIVNMSRLAQKEKKLQEEIIKRKQLILQQLLMNVSSV